MPGKIGTVYVEGPYTFEAETATNKGRMVKFGTGVRKAKQCDTAGELAFGIALEKKAIGEQVAVLRQGRVEDAIAGAALATLHTELATDANGKLVAATTGQRIVGYNLTTAAGDGSEFSMQLDASGRTKA